MNDEIKRVEFENWLRVNTAVRESTARKYGDIALKFFRKYDAMTVQNANKFITESVRGKNSYPVKYALRQLFISLGMDAEDLKKSLRKVKLQPRQKKVNHVSMRKLAEIVDALKNSSDQLIGAMQKATGARAGAIIKISVAAIEFNTPIKVRLIEKGGKVTYIYLSPAKFEKELRKRSDRVYLFLDADKVLSESELEAAAQIRYKAYWNQLRLAAKKCEVFNFGTHDVRRSVAQEMKRLKVPDRTIAKTLSHAGDLRITDRYFADEEENVKESQMMLQRQ